MHHYQDGVLVLSSLSIQLLRSHIDAMLGLIIVLVTSYLYWTWLNRRRSNEPPVYPGAWPIIGHGHLFIGDTLHIWQLAKTITYNCMEMGHACFLRIGHIKIYFLTDPDDISKIVNTCYEKDSFSHAFTGDMLGRGLLFSPVPIWKRHRKLIGPTFNQQILDGFMPIFNSQARGLVKELAAETGGEPVDQAHYIRHNYMKTICLTALGDTISEEEAKNYIKSFETYLNCFITRFQKFWLHSNFFYQFSDLKKIHDACTRALKDICDSVLQRKRTQRELNKYEVNTENSDRKGKTFIDLIMNLDDGEFTDQEIQDEINTIIIGGHDTCSAVSIFGLLLIGSYPGVQEKLYKELQKVFGNTDRYVERQDLSRLVYLEAVLNETMRYYEMAPLIARYIDQEVNLKNCTLRPGHNCFLMLHGVHRSPLWGPDVNEFRPERWLDPETLPANPNAFVAFSLGKRNCIGKRYAMTLLKTTLSHVLRRYKIRSDHTKLVLKMDVLLKPATGYEIYLEDRLK